MIISTAGQIPGPGGSWWHRSYVITERVAEGWKYTFFTTLAALNHTINYINLATIIIIFVLLQLVVKATTKWRTSGTHWSYAHLVESTNCFHHYIDSLKASLNLHTTSTPLNEVDCCIYAIATVSSHSIYHTTVSYPQQRRIKGIKSQHLPLSVGTMKIKTFFPPNRKIARRSKATATYGVYMEVVVRFYLLQQ